MKSVILAGGFGTRLHPYTDSLPKPMLPLGGKPLLEHLIEWSRKNGIRSIVLCVSHMHESIEEHFGDGDSFGVSIEYAVSKKPMSTAGQLKTAEAYIDDAFACMYGDALFGFSLRGMVRQHRADGSFLTMALHPYETTIPYGVMRTGRGGRITSWDEKPTIRADINVGCYIMEPGVFDYIPARKRYGMDDLVRKIISSRRRVGSYLSRRGFTDIGDVASYEAAVRLYGKGGSRA